MACPFLAAVKRAARRVADAWSLFQHQQRRAALRDRQQRHWDCAATTGVV
jgi:hypothetical protein